MCIVSSVLKSKTVSELIRSKKNLPNVSTFFESSDETNLLILDLMR